MLRLMSAETWGFLLSRQPLGVGLQVVRPDQGAECGRRSTAERRQRPDAQGARCRERSEAGGCEPVVKMRTIVSLGPASSAPRGGLLRILSDSGPSAALPSARESARRGCRALTVRQGALAAPCHFGSHSEV